MLLLCSRIQIANQWHDHGCQLLPLIIFIKPTCLFMAIQTPTMAALNAQIIISYQRATSRLVMRTWWGLINAVCKGTTGIYSLDVSGRIVCALFHWVALIHLYIRIIILALTLVYLLFIASRLSRSRWNSGYLEFNLITIYFCWYVIYWVLIAVSSIQTRWAHLVLVSAFYDMRIRCVEQTKEFAQAYSSSTIFETSVLAEISSFWWRRRKNFCRR